MKRQPNLNHWDGIVIGSGISGMTASAYLAKAGLKILLIEQREKVGGYCGSFEREGFIFDEAVHYLNNMGPGGLLRKICQELGITRKIKFIQINPSDRVFISNMEVRFYSDKKRTIEELRRLFPKQKQGIESFFHLVDSFDTPSKYFAYKNLVFKELLDDLFSDESIKTTFSLPAATLGLPATKLSALSALAYYRGSILGGAYHPIGGAQAFSNVLCQQFLLFGGELLLSKTVKRILVSRRSVKGVELSDGTRLSSSFVVAACDATQIFSGLLTQNRNRSYLTDVVKRLCPSTSTFIVYLGLRKPLTDLVPIGGNIWYFPNKKMDESSLDISVDQRQDGFVNIVLSSLHDRNMAPLGCATLLLFSGASFQDSKYWSENRERISDILVRRAEHVIPKLSSVIRIKISATPHTLHRYTLNREGAYRGWSPTPDQTRWGLVPQKTDLNGLYLAGHWTTTQVGNGGVSMVAQSGKNIARAIINALKQNILLK